MTHDEVDIFLLTESRYLDPESPDEYSQTVLLEDRLAQDALEEKGLKVKRVDWADPDVPWQNGKAALFRTTWDYFSRFDEFDPWLRETEKKIQFLNPAPLIKWNMDKHYLADLQERDIPIVPTIFIAPGEKRSLKELTRDLEWNQMILKPAIAGAARHTYRLDKENVLEREAIYRELIEKESMLIQPFISTVLEQGEVSYMVFGGKFTHAILKKAKPGDFRVQDDFGGTVHDYEANEVEIAFAEKAVQACKTLPVYARVDVMVDEMGNMLVSELEMIEPELWFRNNASAARTFADAVMEAMN